MKKQEQKNKTVFHAVAALLAVLAVMLVLYGGGRWLKDGLVDAISSDAHNCTTRATRMQAAYERLCGMLGQPDADALTGRNNALLLTQ